MEELKGFIEVTLITNYKIAYKLKNIKAFKDYRIMLKDEQFAEVKESYEEIKQLIKKAQ